MGERTVQEIFSLAIDKGFYDLGVTPNSSHYMCDALTLMNESSVLSDNEYLNAIEEIKVYLQYLGRRVGGSYDCIFLFDVLRELGILSKELPRVDSLRFLASIYLDWGNRPLI